MSNKNNIDSLAKASKELMLKEPFYGLFLLSLNKKWTDTIVPTAGVCLRNINYELLINSEFWENLEPIQKVGILKHELLHIAFFHLVNYNKYTQKDILNIAMDIEINQYIDRSWLPKEGCFLENFAHLNLEPKKGTVYYYEKLTEAKQQQDDIIEKIISSLGKGENTIELPNGDIITVDQHKWDDIAAMDEATQKLIESQTRHIVLQVAEQIEKSTGNVPGEFTELIQRLRTIEPAKFDWKGYMRRFVGKSTKTYTKKSRRKYNKRTPDYPGLKIKKQKHILAAIDTSASVKTKELKEFYNELHHLKKTGSEITVIQCDTAISDISLFNPKEDLQIHGRGGTDFQPVIDYYNENLNKYSCLFYFTDGEASTPDNARGNILWVLSAQSDMNSDLPGHVINLEL